MLSEHDRSSHGSAGVIGHPEDDGVRGQVDAAGDAAVCPVALVSGRLDDARAAGQAQQQEGTVGLRRGVDITVLSRLMSGGPAQAFGMSKRKGSIAIDNDADLVLVDLESEQAASKGTVWSEGETIAEGLSQLTAPRPLERLVFLGRIGHQTRCDARSVRLPLSKLLLA